MNRSEYEISVIEALKRKAKNAGIAPLPEWISEEVEDNEAALNRGLQNSYTEYMRSRTLYGSRLDELSREGLLGSGYADYLDRLQKKEYEKRERELLSDYSTSEAGESISYDAELDEQAREADSGYYDAINNIVTMGILDYDTAYKQGLNLGFDELRAASIAKTAVTKLRFKLRSKVLNAIVAKKLNRAGAINLALSYGLEYSDALEMGNNAKKINEAHSDTGVYPIGLVDRLKSLENKKRIEEEKKLNEE